MAHTILYIGPPCGGKTTEARKRMGPEDILIDADLLSQALGSVSSHGHSGYQKSLGAKLRDYAIAQTSQMNVTVHVVSASPTAESQISHNDLVLCNPGKAACIARAASRPSWTVAAIEKWYETRKGADIVERKPFSKSW